MDGECWILPSCVHSAAVVLLGPWVVFYDVLNYVVFYDVGGLL
jgi:hypothetical protein